MALGVRAPILFVPTHFLPPVTTLDLLSVPERCSTPRLTRLGIEYGADQRDYDLVRYLAVAFPGLSSLTLYRYRRREETVVCVVSPAIVSSSVPRH